MKKVTKVFLCVCLSLMLSILSLHICWALDISAYAGQSNVSVGSTISVTFRASDDAMRWIYTISYSGNLTLESGSTSVSGSDAYGDSRTHTLIFRANEEGDAWVTAYKENGLVSTDFVEANASASVQFKVVSASSPSDGYHHDDFNNATPGSERQGSALGFDKTRYDDAKDKAETSLRQFLRPEFLARVDEVLTEEDMEKIAALMLEELKKGLAEREIKFGWDDGVLRLAATEAYGHKSGARDLRNVLRRRVEDPICTLLAGCPEPPPALIHAEEKDGEIVLVTA